MCNYSIKGKGEKFYFSLLKGWAKQIEFGWSTLAHTMCGDVYLHLLHFCILLKYLSHLLPVSPKSKKLD